MISTYSVLVRDWYARIRTKNIKVDRWLPTDLKEAFGKLYKVELNQNTHSLSVCLHVFPEDLELKHMHHIIYLTHQYNNLTCNSLF